MCANLRNHKDVSKHNYSTKNESYAIFMRKLLTLVLPITFQQFLLQVR